MKRITTLKTRDLNESKKNGGCGECQTSCQSACKTSCGVANQKCEKIYSKNNFCKDRLVMLGVFCVKTQNN